VERHFMAIEAGLKDRIFDLGVRIARTRLTAAVVARTRMLLLIAALLVLYLGFNYGQDWYVEEFATYDWARDLGI
jgi:hypothetical protein